MSYPAPRYHGEAGEISATIRPSDAPPDLRLGHAEVHYLATGGSTDGLFGLYRFDLDGTPGGAAPHIHRTFSESFFVLSGRIHVYDGQDWSGTTAGDYVYVPEGGIHGYDNRSGEPVSMLILFAPGAPREDYFENLPRLAEMTDEERIAFFGEHDNLYV